MPALGHRQPEAEVGHHRHDDRVVGSRPRRAHVDGADRDHVVAVDDAAGLVDGDQPVAVAVEGEADVGTALDDRGLQVARVGRAAAGVDVACRRARR